MSMSLEYELLEGKGLNTGSPYEEAWREWNRTPTTKEICGDRDPKGMTDEELDDAYSEALARKLELGHQLFPPASGEDLRRRVTV